MSRQNSNDTFSSSSSSNHKKNNSNSNPSKSNCAKVITPSKFLWLSKNSQNKGFKKSNTFQDNTPKGLKSSALCKKQSGHSYYEEDHIFSGFNFEAKKMNLKIAKKRVINFLNKKGPMLEEIGDKNAEKNQMQFVKDKKVMNENIHNILTKANFFVKIENSNELQKLGKRIDRKHTRLWKYTKPENISKGIRSGFNINLTTKLKLLMNFFGDYSQKDITDEPIIDKQADTTLNGNFDISVSESTTTINTGAKNSVIGGPLSRYGTFDTRLFSGQLTRLDTFDTHGLPSENNVKIKNELSGKKIVEGETQQLIKHGLSNMAEGHANITPRKRSDLTKKLDPPVLNRNRRQTICVQNNVIHDGLQKRIGPEKTKSFKRFETFEGKNDVFYGKLNEHTQSSINTENSVMTDSISNLRSITSLGSDTPNPLVPLKEPVIAQRNI